ncbi:MAG: hypothetical protein LBQ66_14345 [Planctomycetaceae bacterium]|jgi:hypothetical protein|nr:hypothetical protein [Planctomycetaceae bacterium]
MLRFFVFVDGLVSWFGDRMNPVVVLELRRQFNLVYHGFNFAIMYGLFAGLLSLLLMFREDVLVRVFKLISATDFVYLAEVILLYQFWLSIVVIPCSLLLLGFFWRLRDPLVLLAVRRDEFYFGLYQLGQFYMFKSFCLLYFWVVVLYMLGLISLDIFFAFPIIWMAGVTVGNMIFSLVIIFGKNKIFSQTLIRFFIIFVFVLVVTFLYYHLFFDIGAIMSGRVVFFVAADGWGWFTVVVVAFLIYYYASWKLTKANLTSVKHPLRKFITTIKIYSAITITTAAAIFAITHIL